MKKLKRWVLDALYKTGWFVTSRKNFGICPVDDIYKLIAPSPVYTIVDIGAHHGESVDRFRQSFGDAEFHLFEPADSAFSVLMERFGGNTKIHLNHAAASDETGTRSLNICKFSLSNSLHTPNTEWTSGNYPESILEVHGAESVQTVRLDEWLESEELKRIDILKIDTQGHEIAVLQGLGNQLRGSEISFIFLELNFDCLYIGQSSTLDLFALLQQREFTLIGLYDVIRDKESGEIMWCNALFRGATDKRKGASFRKK